MPIKGLTTDVQPQFRRIGRLNKGAPKPERGPGKELNYFRFSSEDPEVEQAFRAAFGDKPASLNVYIPHTHPDQAFAAWCEVWGTSGLKHRCDGETAFIWLEGDKYKRGEKPCPGGHTENDPLRDAVGRLDVIIPELIEAGFVGFVSLETHSKHDLKNITARLMAAYEARGGNPLGLRGIRFKLFRVLENISTPGYGNTAGKRTRTDKWLVDLIPAPEWMRLELDRMETDGLLDAGTEARPTASAPALPPSNGGAAPEVITGEVVEAKLDLLGMIEDLGQQLWPQGKWTDVAPTIAESASKTGKKKTVLAELTDKQKENALDTLRARASKLGDLGKLLDHVSKAWPGVEIAVPAAINNIGDDFEALRLIHASAVAGKLLEAQPELTDDALVVAVVTSYNE